MSEQENKTGHKESGSAIRKQKRQDQPDQEQSSAQPVNVETPDSAAQERIQQLETEVKELNDQLLRKTAEFDNFRKRLYREREDSIKYSNGALLNDILPIIDDFERAIQSAAASKDFDAFHAGVSMIEQQMIGMLERKWGLKRFSAGGELFDPEKHEAIAVEETAQYDTEIVLEDYQKGYLLHDRVLRPAKVKVARPVAPERSGGDDQQNKE